MKIISLFIFSIVGLYVTEGQKLIVFPGQVSLMEVLRIPENVFHNFSNPDGKCIIRVGQDSGNCVSLQDCQELSSFVDQHSFKDQKTIKLLRGRVCRISKDQVKFCCNPHIISQSTTSSPHIITKSTDSTPSNSTSTEPSTITSIKPETNNLLPSLQECGQSYDDRIVQGEAVSHGQYPWLVGIGRYQSGAYLNVCGGSLITRKHVLTAAHCFLKRRNVIAPSHVILGEYSLSKETELEPPIVIEIASRRSPGYNSTTQVNDIELLFLTKEVEFTDFIRPVCLPFGYRGTNFENVMMTIIGWGDTAYRSYSGSDIPLEAVISVVSKTSCKEAYKKVPHIPLDAKQICAGQGPKDSCQGDSGGPLLYFDEEENFRFFVMGIVSFGVQCGNPSYPGVYTFVPEFLPWITDNLS